MSEENVLDDVRQAKLRLDLETPTWDALATRLAATQLEFEQRVGRFVNLPRQRPKAIQDLIDQAEDEPGRELLNETRSVR